MGNRIALVTGANKGIGLETAKQLGAHGMTVLMGARDAVRGQEAVAGVRESGVDAHYVQLDVTDDASVAAAAERIERDFGRLDVLVNNAGTASVARQRTQPSETSVEDMKAVYDINVFGLVRVTNAMLPLLQKADSARIVNVSSEAGSISLQTGTRSPIGALPASAQYPSSKAAVNMLTAQYAKQFRGTSIKVNAANPGFTRTDFTGGRGVRSAAQGAEPIVHLATLPDDGPSGVLYGHVWTTEGDGDGGYGLLEW